jgi:hypothetical protein
MLLAFLRRGGLVAAEVNDKISRHDFLLLLFADFRGETRNPRPIRNTTVCHRFIRLDSPLTVR